ERLLAGSQDVPMPEPVHPARVSLLSITDKLDVSLSVWLPRNADVPPIEEALRRASLRALQAAIQAAAAAAAAATAAKAAAAADATAEAAAGPVAEVPQTAA